MNFKKTIFAALLAFVGLNAFAQDKQTEEVFAPHWYVQVQGGVQYTLGEVDFGDLLSPHAQIGVGYNFNKVLGARFSVNAWQSKAGSDFNEYTYTNGVQTNSVACNPRWKWNYVAPNVDLTVNLSNLFCGYKADRVFTVGAFVGVGANVAFKNDEAKDVYNTYYSSELGDDQFLHYFWEGTKVRLSGRAGLTGDLRLSDRVSLGLELNSAIVNDHYNSKKAGDKSVDWMFNGLIGLKFNLGKTHTSKEVKGCDPQIIYKDRIVEKIVEKPVEKIVEKQVAVEEEPLKETIFYAICVSDPDAESILNKVVAWCNKYPSKTITVDGYADKGTGNAQSNVTYAQKRAEKVAKRLQEKGVSADRMTVRSYGDTVQPFPENDKNRCVIIVGK